MKKPILIIVFRFPPMGGIGSRRWAKFAKYLAQDGYHVHVLTIDYPYSDLINWTRDVQGKEIIVHRVRSDYPVFMLKENKSFTDKVLSYLFSKTLEKLFFYLDPAQRWGKRLIPYAVKLIRDKKIKNVIVSGPPSSVHYAGALIKAENPGINLIQDYRDPWNSDRDYEYGTKLPFKWQKDKSLKMEEFTIKHSDSIVVVTIDMKKLIDRQFKDAKMKTKVIYNGYDCDDYNFLRNSEKKHSFDMIYAGSVDFSENGRGKALEYIAEAIQSLNDDFINNNLKVIIHSNLRFQNASDNKFKNHFVFNPLIPINKIFTEMNNYSYCLSINAIPDAHAFGTKIFNYMALGKKILHISNGGELYELMEKTGQFVSRYDIESIKKQLLLMKEDFLSRKCDEPQKQNMYGEFNIKELTKQVEQLLI